MDDNDFTQTIYCAPSHTRAAERNIYADWLDEQGRHEEASVQRTRARIPAALDDYAWSEVFGVCGDPAAQHTTFDMSSCRPGDTTPTTPFGRHNVVEILASQEGDNDGPDWVAVGRLDDGRWFAVRAGCDYTGWD